MLFQEILATDEN